METFEAIFVGVIVGMTIVEMIHIFGPGCWECQRRTTRPVGPPYPFPTEPPKLPPPR